MTARTTVKSPTGLLELVGAQLGTSPWHRVGQADIDRFARVTRDEQWIHVDAARAVDGPYGRTIAHGFLTLSLCSWFLARTIEVRGARAAVNYGLDRVRFPSPVPEGSRLRGATTLAAATAGEGAIQATFRITVHREGEPDRPACVADQLCRYLL